MQASQGNVRFADLVRVASHFFGEPRQRGSHVTFTTGLKAAPHIVLQDDKGKAKAYQVRQVLVAIRRFESDGS